MTGGLFNVANLFPQTGLPVFFDTAGKSFVLLAVAGVVCACLRRGSAATRHWIWSLAVAGAVSLPILSLLVPASPQPVWTLSAEATGGNELAIVFELAPSKAARPEVEAQGSSHAKAAATAKEKSARRVETRLDQRWFVLIPVLWLVGVVVLLVWLVRGWLQVRAIRRRAQPAAEEHWNELLGALSEQMCIRRKVLLLRSAEDLMPMTWGWWRPAILLPARAEQWAPEKLRVVLLHELAHIRRGDVVVQAIASFACAVYWFNPLAWLAARRMCIERERACDDLVLNLGCRASDYAGHLVEIARSFRRVPHVAAIAMARSSGLQGRVTAIVDASRSRRAPRRFALGLLGAAVVCLAAALAAQRVVRESDGDAESLRQRLIARLQEFAAAKEKQSETLAAAAGENISPEFRRFFRAAKAGDFATVTNMYDDFKKRHPQYWQSKNDTNLAVRFWSPVLEICLAYYDVAAGEPKYIQMAVDDIFASVPPGGIYFGGTDPGRGLPTAFSKSHADANPFFTLTQNQLVNDNYLQYLRSTYGDWLSIPSDLDSTNCFDEYTTDAQKRMAKGQLRPGEDVRMVDGKPKVSGQVAVMAVNALLAKLIFDRNPDREFYVEESFPLDWMYPRLEPNGLILKLNRRPLPRLPDEVIERDRQFWTERVDGMLGPWLRADTTVQEVADFAERIHVRKDLDGFHGDARFVRNEYAQKMFSKWRSAIAGVFAWRANFEGNETEKQRLTRAADYGFRQAYALCPSSPEALYRYVQLLASDRRFDEAIAITTASSHIEPENAGLANLLKQLRRMKDQAEGRRESANAAPTAIVPNGVTVNTDFSSIAAAAQEYLSAGRTNDALRIADGYLGDTKADAKMISLAAQIYQQSQNYPKLELALKRWVEFTPTPEAWLDYAASQAIQGKEAEAIESLKRALALNRERLRTNSAAADISAGLGRDPRFMRLRANRAFIALLPEDQHP